MIKVTETKTINLLKKAGVLIRIPEDVTVAPAKLVLVECKPEEAILVLSQYGYGLITSKCNESGTWVDVKGKNWTISCPIDTIKYLKPILISETENIEIGEIGLNSHNQIFQYGELSKQLSEKDPSTSYRKILALPEHFSPKTLQDIVEDKLKDRDKVYVECESTVLKDKYSGLTLPGEKFDYRIDYYYPKLNPYITLHKVEEKMYTRKEVRSNVIQALVELADNAVSGKEVIEWFEKNDL